MAGIFSSSKAVSKPVAVGALNIQQSCYGTPINLVYGTNRISGNLIWYGDFRSVLVSTGGSSGKGGLFSSNTSGQQYEYYASFMFGLCEGPIHGVNSVWISKKISDLTTEGGTLFTGTNGQSAWGYLTSYHPTEADTYSNLAHVDFSNYYLGTSAETPQFSFEVEGIGAYADTYAGQDALADTVIADFLARANFPAAYIGSFTDAHDYWLSMGFFISPVIDQQKQAMDWLNEWMKTLNAEFVWTAGILNIVPYADTPVSGNGTSFTPDMTPQYDLNDDHFICGDDEDPVTLDRENLPDAFNRMPIEYVNKANQYNVETYTAEDPAHIDQYGTRTGSTISAHHITDPNLAQTMAYMKLWRSIYIDKGNIYRFKLPWNFIRLDPMDLVTITDAGLGLDHQLVRIKKITEDEESGELSFEAEDVPGQLALPALYSTQGTVRYTADYNADPGNVNTPIIFETPLELVQSSSIELSLAVSGGADWGGCNVWVSTDDITYMNIGQINTPARQGILTATLPTFTPGANNIDTTNTLSIDMTTSRGSFNNASTNADALNYNTLCYVDGELISFGNDSLTSQYNYDLTYLNRGCYGSPINQHLSGKDFVRYDSSVYRYSLDQSRVGQTLYFKFQSFNLFRSGLQDISTLPSYAYLITGSALLSLLDPPQNLTVNYLSNVAQLNWDKITDTRTPLLYEIRKGADFNSAQMIGRTANVSFPVYGAGTYWISALFITPFGVCVYSDTPNSIIVSAANLPQNIVDNWDEKTTSWSGTQTNCSVSGGNLITTLGAATASYEIPTGHIISGNYVMNGRVTINWESSASSVTSDITGIADIPSVLDMTFASEQGLVTVVPQINMSQDGSTWDGWQNWVAGVYTFKAIKFRLIATISNPTYQAVISGFSFMVDIDNLVQSGSVNTSATGVVTVTFTNQYNSTPHVDPQIVGASAGDTVILSSVGTTGFGIQVLDGSGNPVVRTVSWSATGW